jgi:hypothetical protein
MKREKADRDDDAEHPFKRCRLDLKVPKYPSHDKGSKDHQKQGGGCQS